MSLKNSELCTLNECLLLRGKESENAKFRRLVRLCIPETNASIFPSPTHARYHPLIRSFSHKDYSRSWIQISKTKEEKVLAFSLR